MRVWCHPNAMGSPLGSDGYAELLRSAGIERTDDPAKADCLVAARIKSLVPAMIRHPRKRCLVWTNEPGDCHSSQRRIKPLPLLGHVEVMSVFTGDIFWHNFHFLGSYHCHMHQSLGIDLRAELPLLDRRPSRPTGRAAACAVFSKRMGRGVTCVVDGVERDLNDKRCRLALALREAGVCDIIGSGWGDGIAIEESGFGRERGSTPWWTRKLEIIRNYDFNVCIENTLAPHYCTEKIWHAIWAGTLPIYWGQESLSETFPRDSFVDASAFGSPGELARALGSMSDAEYVERMNRCREIYNRHRLRRLEEIGREGHEHVRRVTERLLK